MGNNYSSHGGQSAGRDIRNLNLHLGSLKPESQLQDEFAQRTGIWCPKPAREWLENLMDEHRFTAKELSVAWKAGSLGWSTKIDAQKIVTPLLEAIFAYGLLLVLVICFLLLAIPFALVGYVDTAATSAFFTSSPVFVVVCWMINRFMLWPRRVALRIKRIEQGSREATSNRGRND